jgi:hypothetical protein
MSSSGPNGEQRPQASTRDLQAALPPGPSPVRASLLDPPLSVLPLDPDVDEFDLDLRLGELSTWGTVPATWNPLDAQTDPGGCVPTARQGAEGGTCNTEEQTCVGTCAGRDTCPRTGCGDTCGNTCPDTCPDTCRRTCEDTCAPCPTELGTHCNTCRPGCQPQ